MPVALDGRALAGGGLPRKKILLLFLGFFSHFHFAECKSLPSAFPALGKGFAECPTKSTRQIAVCRQKDAVCCMPSVTLGKAVAEWFWAIAECPWHSAKRLYPVVNKLDERWMFYNKWIQWYSCCGYHDIIHWFVHIPSLDFKWLIRFQMNTLMFTTPSVQKKTFMFQDSKFVPIKNLMF